MKYFQLVDYNDHTRNKILSFDDSITIDIETLKTKVKKSFRIQSQTLYIINDSNTLYHPDMYTDDQTVPKLFFSCRDTQATVWKKSNEPSVFFNVIANKSYIPTEAVNQLRNLPSIFPNLTHLIGMPDLHQGMYPIGSVCISRDTVYPELIGSDIGCGMSFVKLDLNVGRVDVEKMAKRMYLENDVNDFELSNQKYFHQSIQWPEHIEPLKTETHLHSMGTIGNGNHFVEIQEIHTIVNAELAAKYELDDTCYYATAHSGSRDLGKNVLDRYLKGEITLDKYEVEHDYAIQWARFNRHAIVDRMAQCLQEEPVDYTCILDLYHNYFERTEYGIIHRKGAAPALDKPVIIPGSRGAFTYVVEPINSRIENGFSVAHGAGRKLSRNGASTGIKNRREGDKKYCLESKCKDIHNIVICENEDLLYEEAPYAYKDVGAVIEDLVEANLIQIIAIMKPVITYKCKEKQTCCC